MGNSVDKRLSRSFTNYLKILRNPGCCRVFVLKITSGFTMVELLVAISVSALLLVAGISILNPTLQIQRANDTKRKANLAKIQTALELFRSVNSVYPPTSVGFLALYQGTPQYLPKSPDGEPKASDLYYYTASPSNCDNATTGQCTEYTLIACLENASDTERDPANDATCVPPLWSKTVKNP